MTRLYHSRTARQIVKLPSNFMQCGAKFKHATQTVGKKRYFWPDNIWKYLTLFVNKSIG